MDKLKTLEELIEGFVIKWKRTDFSDKMTRKVFAQELARAIRKEARVIRKT